MDHDSDSSRHAKIERLTPDDMESRPGHGVGVTEWGSGFLFLTMFR
jgi:hypothetical protein